MKEQNVIKKCICTLGSESVCHNQPVPAEVCCHCGWELHEGIRRTEMLKEYGLKRNENGLYSVCDESDAIVKEKQWLRKQQKGRCASGKRFDER